MSNKRSAIPSYNRGQANESKRETIDDFFVPEPTFDAKPSPHISTTGSLVFFCDDFSFSDIIFEYVIIRRNAFKIGTKLYDLAVRCSNTPLRSEDHYPAPVLSLPDNDLEIFPAVVDAFRRTGLPRYLISTSSSDAPHLIEPHPTGNTFSYQTYGFFSEKDLINSTSEEKRFIRYLHRLVRESKQLRDS